MERSDDLDIENLTASSNTTPLSAQGIAFSTSHHVGIGTASPRFFSNGSIGITPWSPSHGLELSPVDCQFAVHDSSGNKVLSVENGVVKISGALEVEGGILNKKSDIDHVDRSIDNVLRDLKNIVGGNCDNL